VTYTFTDYSSLDVDSMRGWTDRVRVVDQVQFTKDVAQVAPAPGGDSSWRLGGLTRQELDDGLNQGSLKHVDQVDALMSQFKTLTIQSRRYEIRPSVAGGAVNVGAYIAGQPMHMRRYERVLSGQAPLTVVANLMASESVSSNQMRARGATILAFVRIMAAIRPVTLYVMGGGFVIPSPKTAIYYIVKLDTCPIDLARAAHIFCESGVTRCGIMGVIYAMGNATPGAMGWPYRSRNLITKHLTQALFSRFLPEAEYVYVPAYHQADAIATAPELWIKSMIEQYAKRD
jgi:hypothetical protein